MSHSPYTSNLETADGIVAQRRLCATALGGWKKAFNQQNGSYQEQCDADARLRAPISQSNDTRGRTPILLHHGERSHGATA